MTLTQIPGTNVFFGSTSKLTQEELTKKGIKTVFTLDRKPTNAPYFSGTKTIAFKSRFHPSVNPLAFTQLMNNINRLKTNVAITCMFGRHNSPIFAIAALRLRGHSTYSIQQALKGIPGEQVTTLLEAYLRNAERVLGNYQEPKGRLTIRPKNKQTFFIVKRKPRRRRK